MRQKRAKAYKKQMNVYIHSFKFREPFQTVIDAELVLTCDNSSFNLIKGLNRTIQSEVKPMITQCCMQALYQSRNQRAIDTAKTFERRRCNHPPNDPLPPADCIKSVVCIDGKNKHRYVVATQDYELRKALRKVPGVPIAFMNRSVMVMEPISKATLQYSAQFERAKLTGGLNDAVKAGLNIESDNEEQSQKATKPEPKKRKGPKGPNPLSVKKRKVSSENETQEKKTKRRRKHKTEGSTAEHSQNPQVYETNGNSSPKKHAQESLAKENDSTSNNNVKDPLPEETSE